MSEGKKMPPAAGINCQGDPHDRVIIPFSLIKYKPRQVETFYILKSLSGDPCGLPMARACKRLADSLGVQDEN